MPNLTTIVVAVCPTFGLLSSSSLALEKHPTEQKKDTIRYDTATLMARLRNPIYLQKCRLHFSTPSISYTTPNF